MQPDFPSQPLAEFHILGDFSVRPSDLSSTVNAQDDTPLTPHYTLANPH